MKALNLALAVSLSAISVLAVASDISLTNQEQKQLDLTVYSDFGVVRDLRETVLPRGITDVDYLDVAKTIDPATVRVRSVGKEDLFGVTGQTYRYDLLNRHSLLERYIGRKLKYSRNVLEGKTYEKVLREGILLSIDPEIVKFGDEVEISPEGTISLPYVPEGLHTVPTLTWRVNNRVQGTQTLETSYVADGLSWTADYVLTLGSENAGASLGAWVSLTNQSGLDYRNARVRLVAGEVNRQKARQPVPMAAMESTRMAKSQVRAQSFFDYYAYDLPAPLDLGNRQTKQVRLMKVSSVPVVRQYVLDTNIVPRMNPAPDEDRFDIHLVIANDQGGKLGIPLPEGRFRVFQQDSDGAVQMLGEDNLETRAVGQPVDVTVGKAFDIIATHTQTDYRRTGDHGAEASYRIDLRNSKSQSVTVILNERISGDWDIIKQSASGKKTDSGTLQYEVTLAGGATRSIDYSVRFKY